MKTVTISYQVKEVKGIKSLPTKSYHAELLTTFYQTVDISTLTCIEVNKLLERVEELAREFATI